MASLRDTRAADRKKKQNKLEKYVRKKAARAVRGGKAYRPKGKNAEERAMMVAVAKEVKGKLEKKMEVTDRVAKDAACLSKKAMACSSKAMAAVATVAESEATTKTEVEELRKRQEVLECKQETIDGMKEELEMRWEQMLPMTSQQRLQKFTANLANDAMAVAAQAMAADGTTAERVAAMGTEYGEAIEGLGKRQKVLELELRELMQNLGTLGKICSGLKRIEALGDRMQRIEAEIQTMKDPNGAVEPERHTFWLTSLQKLMKEFREELGQLQNQAEKNHPGPGT